MSALFTYTINDLVKWHIGFDVAFDNNSQLQIVIPVETLQHLTDAQIASYVRSFAIESQYIAVRVLADGIIWRNQARQHGYDIADETELAKLIPYRDRDPVIEQAIEICELVIEQKRIKAEAKAKKKQQRAQVTSQYDAIFISIGKRDGFHCAQCKATEHLHIDHVKPISLGGSNDLTNLQFLCATCNIAKGATEADYRQGGAS